MWIVYSIIPQYLLLHYTWIGRGTTLRMACKIGFYISSLAAVAAIILLWLVYPPVVRFWSCSILLLMPMLLWCRLTNTSSSTCAVSHVQLSTAMLLYDELLCVGTVSLHPFESHGLRFCSNEFVQHICIHLPGSVTKCMYCVLLHGFVVSVCTVCCCMAWVYCVLLWSRCRIAHLKLIRCVGMSQQPRHAQQSVHMPAGTHCVHGRKYVYCVELVSMCCSMTTAPC